MPTLHQACPRDGCSDQKASTRQNWDMVLYLLSSISSVFPWLHCTSEPFQTLSRLLTPQCRPPDLASVFPKPFWSNDPSIDSSLSSPTLFLSGASLSSHQNLRGLLLLCFWTSWAPPGPCPLLRWNGPQHDQNHQVIGDLLHNARPLMHMMGKTNHPIYPLRWIASMLKGVALWFFSWTLRTH